MGRLKTLLQERERGIAEDKFSALQLKEQDPIKWEMLYTKLAGVAQNAKEMAKRISASPAVRESGECLFALFTPEGDSIAFSDGLMLHIATMGSSIKWMIQNDYEENEGIRDGDFFFNNDPHIGSAHAPDQMLLGPIVHKGEVVGWAGGLTHVAETGATEAGGSSPNAMSRYDEGIYWPCIRIGEKWELNRNLERIVERGTRSPQWWLLDNRAKAGGVRMIRDAVLEIIDEFGLDYYLRALYEYIEDTRRATIKKLRGLMFPGKYRSVILFDVPYAGKNIRYPIDHMVRIQVEMTVRPDGGLTIDFDGTSPPGRHPYNSSLPTLVGVIMNWGMQQLLYDIKHNQGIAQVLTNSSSLHVPDGVCVNPKDITFSTSLFQSAFAGYFALSLCESRAHYPLGYREMIVSGHCFGPGTRVGGKDQYGKTHGGTIFETTCRGFPAMGVMDGLDACYVAFNPAGDCGDAERWEMVHPLIYLGRRIWRGHGFGRYRGGEGLESLCMVINSDDVSLSSSGGGCRVFGAQGLMGGYPGSTSYKYVYRNTNYRETAGAHAPLPTDEGGDPEHPAWTALLKGESTLTDVPTLAAQYKSYDLWHQMVGAAGGYGDPIERDPEAVKRDLELGLCSLHSAENAYCVKIDPDTLEIDHEVTRTLREAMRRKRLERGIPTQEYIRRIREKLSKGDIPEVSKKCLNDCMRISNKFLGEFKQAWGLPEDFTRIS